MTAINVQLENITGELLNPATLASLVTNSVGETLESVEAGAQENTIESISYSGEALSITDKNVNLPVFTIAKLSTATEGYAATYQLTKDGIVIGDAINIPKDLVVESGTVKTCTVADVPVQGYQVGDKYIDLVLANSTDAHLYILVSDLIDTYTAGAGISITGTVINNTGVISISNGSITGTLDINTGGSISSIPITYNTMTGASASVAGTSGLVPAPIAGAQDKCLKGDGTWGDLFGGTYGTCTTAANTAAKEVTVVSGIFKLEAGMTISVTFTNANTASTAPTLNVAGLGAKNIFFRGSQIIQQYYALLAGAVTFLYDGIQFHIIGNYLSNVSYRVLT